uniref:Uncharacterized protein n=1 Tax=Arundo donax TaxID=35708 RepID=A0A0A9HBQ2_ARUDO
MSSAGVAVTFVEHAWRTSRAVMSVISISGLCTYPISKLCRT